MKLSRLFKPRNPLFWLMLVINTISLVLGWIAQSWTLTALGLWLVGGFGLANAALGMWLAWRLIRHEST